ncbi:MAG: hypothetical protein ABIH67_05455 [Candidatus Uhrbacteria bacterium]
MNYRYPIWTYQIHILCVTGLSWNGSEKLDGKREVNDLERRMHDGLSICEDNVVKIAAQITDQIKQTLSFYSGPAGLERQVANLISDNIGLPTLVCPAATPLLGLTGPSKPNASWDKLVEDWPVIVCRDAHLTMCELKKHLKSSEMTDEYGLENCWWMIASMGAIKSVILELVQERLDEDENKRTYNGRSVLVLHSPAANALLPDYERVAGAGEILTFTFVHDPRVDASGIIHMSNIIERQEAPRSE